MDSVDFGMSSLRWPVSAQYLFDNVMDRRTAHCIEIAAENAWFCRAPLAERWRRIAGYDGLPDYGGATRFDNERSRRALDDFDSND